jgi:hypothetical protein
VGQKKRITQIPLPGGSGRIRSGAIQFQDDWPGLLIRGDEAIPIAVSIRVLEERLQESRDPLIVSALGRLGQWAEIIERDVILR